LAFGYKQYRDQKKAQTNLEEAQLKLADAALNAEKWCLIPESRALAAQAELMVARDRAKALNLTMRDWQTAKTEEANPAVDDVASAQPSGEPLKGHSLRIDANIVRRAFDSLGPRLCSGQRAQC